MVREFECKTNLILKINYSNKKNSLESPVRTQEQTHTYKSVVKDICVDLINFWVKSWFTQAYGANTCETHNCI
jgi:hypothetical protein